tara:strand:+ start:752 stop:1015 length:264 start_codon:yes stop_codon:yes gene_type:complete
MAKYEIELTDTEDKAMSYSAFSNLEWIKHAVKDKARKCKERIIAANVAHCNANGITIATGEDAQVTQAFDLKVVKTAKERNEEAEKL